MKRTPLVLLIVSCLILILQARPTYSQSGESVTSRARRPDLGRTRKVGYLERIDGQDRRFRLKDVWSHETYQVAPAGGLDLKPYLGRYVSMHGRTIGDRSSELQESVLRESALREFRVEKVVDLDRRRRGQPPAVARAVEQVDYEEILPAQNIEIQLPSEVLGSEFMLESEPGAFTEALDIPPARESFLQPIPETIDPVAFPGFAESFWVRAEYLWWWTDGLRLPPLVTTSPNGTARPQAGVLGNPGTRVLSPIAVNNDAHTGFRIRTGMWIGGGGALGIGGDYYGLNHQAAGYSATSNGAPILARPFFDALNAQETAELVAFPGVIGGTVALDARTEFQSAGAHLLFNLCNADWSDACQYNGSRIDGIIGYRYARLRDNLVVTENLTSQDMLNPGSFQIRDLFDTVNEFHGGEIGFQYHRRNGPWMIEALSKIALGNNHQVVAIDGTTRLVTAGVDTTLPGGLLAQRTNIGRFVRDEFAVLPELGITVGYRVTPRLSVTLGYTLVYLSNVVRAGDQVDLDVNPNLLPPEAVPFTGPLRPQFAFQQTDFWAQGFSVGGDFRW